MNERQLLILNVLLLVATYRNLGGVITLPDLDDERLVSNTELISMRQTFIDLITNYK